MIPLSRSLVFSQVAVERGNQDEKWGEQNHPDHDDTASYTGLAEFEYQADRWKLINEERAERRTTAWDGILLEEVFEAVAETDPLSLRAELVQVAAVAIAWVECLDRRDDSRRGLSADDKRAERRCDE